MADTDGKSHRNSYYNRKENCVMNIQEKDSEKNIDSTKLAEVEKLKKTISEAELKMKKLHEEIGQIIYDKYKDNPLPEVEEKIKMGLNIENAITACKTRISVLQENPKCPACGIRLKQEMVYCFNCGKKVKEESVEKREGIYCSKCGEKLETGSTFCTSCGKKVEV